MTSKKKVNKEFPIIEIFGPTIQGEGYLVGRKTHFIRFGGCDYRCSWCDSLFAVLPEEVQKNKKMMTAHQIANSIDAIDWGLIRAPWVTLSGGNPALFDLGELISILHNKPYLVTIETQGSIWKGWMRQLDFITVSPKPPSSGNVTDNASLLPFSEWYKVVGNMGMCFKIVIFDDNDWAYAEEIHRQFPAIPLYLSVGNHVGADSTEALLTRLDWLAQKVIKSRSLGDSIVLPQLHVLLWGNKQGV